jgi:pseudouridine-5'-phosphate glycosidase/pseudouridine kinase
MILAAVSRLRIFPPEVTQWGLGMTHGVLFGVPIPESYSAVGNELQEAVEQAIQESQENGMDKQGKQVTPWLLERVRQLTAGKSLASSKCISDSFSSITNCRPCADIALIENTALKGAQIAVAYSELIKQHEPKHVTTVRL